MQAYVFGQIARIDFVILSFGGGLRTAIYFFTSWGGDFISSFFGD